MKQGKKFNRVSMILTVLLTIGLACASASAAIYICPRADNDAKSIQGTLNMLHNSTTLTVNIPILATCHVESSGYSEKSFYPNSTGYTSQFLNHTIEVISGGIGSVNVSLSGSTPISVTGTTNDRIYGFSTNRVDYTINQSIWRLYFYNETHEGSHLLKKPDGTIYTTVMLSTFIQW